MPPEGPSAGGPHGFEHETDYPSQWAAIGAIAPKSVSNGMESSPPYTGVAAPHWWVRASLTSLRMTRTPHEH